jgi:hypothetical protein
VEFADADAVVFEGFESLLGVLEFDGEVAGVVVDAEVGEEAVVVGAFGVEAIEELDDFSGRFYEAEGFRFEVQVEGMSGFLLELVEEVDAFPELLGDGIDLGIGVDEGFEGAGDGTDAALDGFRQDFREDVEELLCVLEAGGLGPVGCVDLFLDSGAVEGSVGESVNGEDVGVMLLEPVFEGVELVGLGEFGGSGGAEAEADGVGLVGADLLADVEDVGIEVGEDLIPGFAAVDIGTVGQVEAVGELHGWGIRRGG